MDCWPGWRNTDQSYTAAATQRLFYIDANLLASTIRIKKEYNIIQVVDSNNTL
jgi:hypothetical protein